MEKEKEKENGAQFDARRHLIKLRGGREYLPVAHRLVWFRQEHPDWTIRTDIHCLDVQGELVVITAEILDDKGRLRASAHKLETSKGFEDFLEKAETGAIGRALALVGFGTQFAPEFDEGEVVDTPIKEPGWQPRQKDYSRLPAPPSGEVCDSCGAGLTEAQVSYSTRHFQMKLCRMCQAKQREIMAKEAGARG